MLRICILIRHPYGFCNFKHKSIRGAGGVSLSGIRVYYCWTFLSLPTRHSLQTRTVAAGENQLRSAIWSEISILKDHHHHHHSYLGNSPIEGWVRLTWLLDSRRRGLKGIIILRNNLVYIEMVLKEQSIIRTSVNIKCPAGAILPYYRPASPDH